MATTRWRLAAARAPATTEPAVERQASVVIGSRGLTLSPAHVKTVADSTLIVVFRIRNATPVGRRLVVGSFRSPVVPPGRTRRYSVAFVRPGPISCRSTPGRGNAFARTLTITA